jgi:fluoroacetyl-CoA thioesterase
MKAPPPTGTTGKLAFVVETKHAIELPDLPPVLSTPSLLWHLEHAAIEALRPVLEAGEISVGTEVELQHRSPTPLGQWVTCLARVVRADGRKVSFQVEARDQQELVARGSHTRFVVQTAAFAQRIQAKATMSSQ